MNANYIEKVFGKSRGELSLNDLRDYFSTQQEESSVVEFKSGKVEINDIFKEITAFLNTEGGLLIIGAPVEGEVRRGKNKIKVCQGNLTFSNFRNKDWLYQKIASNIVPVPTNLKIEEFLTEEGNVFVLDIPQSLNPPHQSSSDGRYYLRLERDAKPAPHGVVQALFNKRKVSELTAEVDFEKIDESTDDVTVTLKNISRVPAEKVSYVIEIINVNSVNDDFQFIEDELGNKFSLTINPDQILVRVLSFPYNIRIEHMNSEYMVFVGFWGRDLDFDCVYLTYCPEQKKTISRGTMDDGDLFSNELKRIQNQ